MEDLKLLRTKSIKTQQRQTRIKPKWSLAGLGHRTEGSNFPSSQSALCLNNSSWGPLVKHTELFMFIKWIHGA